MIPIHSCIEVSIQKTIDKPFSRNFKAIQILSLKQPLQSMRVKTFPLTETIKKYSICMHS